MAGDERAAPAPPPFLNLPTPEPPRQHLGWKIPLQLLTPTEPSLPAPEMTPGLLAGIKAANPILAVNLLEAGGWTT